ncbi:MAG: IS1380 family transposase, partial [bacterium]
VNKVKIRFTNKKLTAYGGFSLLAAFFERIKLREAIKKAIPVEEVSPNGMGIYSKILAYSLMLYAGGSRFSHILYLGSEQILSTLFATNRLPRASTTLTRLFGKINKLKDVEWMSDVLWGYLSKLIPWGKINQDWLTFDSTVLERYGKQEGVKRGYNPKKKGRGSHSPLIGFLNKSKYVVNLSNRFGNVASWNNILSFFESTWTRVNGLIKINGVIADSGFYLLDFIHTLEAKGLSYIISARLYTPLQRKVYSLSQWEEVAEGIWVSEFMFGHYNWDKERRYIAVRQHIKRREHAMGKVLSLFKNEVDMRDYRYSVWVTNLSDKPYEVWNKCRPRANDENTIKELKEDFALGGFSMKKFYSTEASMQIRVFMYNLFVLFRQEILENKEKTQRLLTLRYKYFVLPGQLGSEGRSKVLRISAIKHTLRAKLRYLFNRINQYVPADEVNCNAFG